MDTHVGRILLTLNGIPIAQAKSVKPKDSLGAKALKGMSPTGKPIGKVSGTPDYTVDLELYMPKIEVTNWHTLDGAVLTISPRDGLGPTVIYTGGFTIEVSAQYGEEGEAMRNVQMGFLDRREIG
jgi:hypothetical protein